MAVAERCNHELVQLSPARWFCTRCRLLVARFAMPANLKPGDGYVVP